MTVKKLCVLAVCILLAAVATNVAEPIDIGSRLEPLVDDYLVERLDRAALRLHFPAQREIVLEMDRPWEGVYSGYFTVMKDGNRYRMYYRGLPEAKHAPDTEVTCYAESDDGIHWRKPNLGLFEVRGTKENNVVLARHRACHNFAPMLDANPRSPADQRYKALGGTGRPGLIAFVSRDGIHWKELRKEPVITEGRFDSQNVSFWSAAEGCYLCYFRVRIDGMRWIARTTSKDFVNWTRLEVLTLDGKPRQHLYTNQLAPYVRAPHVYIGTPTRFMQGRWALSAEQIAALGTPKQYVKDCTDITLISTRGGDELKRTFLEAYLRPGPDPRNWTSRASYAAAGILHTGPGELSLYVQHHCGYPTAHLRRYTLRLDGFASVNAPFTGGEMVTKPLRFSGNRLAINFSTSAAGSVRVEIQDLDGKSIPGFALEDCPEIIGDQTQRIVSWKQGQNLGALMGKPVRLRFVLEDADLFAFQFINKGAEMAELLLLCDANAKIVEKQIDLSIPPPKPLRGFCLDSYTVRALSVAYDITGKPEYLDTCKRWSDRMIRDQKGMIAKGAYYMNYGRAPSEDEDKWYVADCASIALGVLATAVRCDNPAEKAKYLDSVKSFFRLVADNWVRPSGGIANGHWPKSDDEYWCATGIFGSLAFCLFKETGDPEYLKIGQGTIDWLNRQNLLTVARDFYPEERIKLTVMMYCLEAYSAGLPHLKPGSQRHKATLAQLAKAHRWILDNTGLSSSGKYLSHWGSKRGGLPFHLYAYAVQVPGNEKLVVAADCELALVGEKIRNALAEGKFSPAQLTDFTLMSYAEKVNPGGIYRTSKDAIQMQK